LQCVLQCCPGPVLVDVLDVVNDVDVAAQDS